MYPMVEERVKGEWKSLSGKVFKSSFSPYKEEAYALEDRCSRP